MIAFLLSPAIAEGRTARLVRGTLVGQLYSRQARPGPLSRFFNAIQAFGVRKRAEHVSHATVLSHRVIRRQLFATSRLEKAALANMEELANNMGLLLQKTNIIRDYLEDIVEQPAPRSSPVTHTRCFWSHLLLPDA